MPTVTFLGPFFERRRHDSPESWIRSDPVQVSQAWLSQWRHSLPLSQFLIEGEEGVTVDAGNDNIPDTGWSRKDILAWMNDNNLDMGNGYLTKTAALKLVEESLSVVGDSTETTGDEQ